MRPRWNHTGRFWDDFDPRWQAEYSINMKKLGPAAMAFAQKHISRRRAVHRTLLRLGARPERLILSEFRTPRRFLPKDKNSN